VEEPARWRTGNGVRARSDPRGCRASLRRGGGRKGGRVAHRASEGTCLPETLGVQLDRNGQPNDPQDLLRVAQTNALVRIGDLNPM